MMDKKKEYPSKILLFGEYAVLQGADALAVPFPHFHGKWAWTEDGQPSDLQQGLYAFLAFLEQGGFPGFQAETMRAMLDKGLYFQSNIPSGYGAGSSGALCAAVYDSFIKNEGHSLGELKELFARMENFFHGSSSGFDPLVSYIGKATHLSGTEIHNPILAPCLESFFLVDTGMPRQAEAYIHIFKEKCQNASFSEALRERFVPLTQAAIRSVLSLNHPSLYHTFQDISHYQHQYFKEMIPASILPLWEKGMEDSCFTLKICGAGGGGFLLGISRDWAATLKQWAGWKLLPLWEQGVAK